MVRLTQGSPPVLSLMLLKTTENRIDEETPKRVGTEGGRFTGSTEDSGPMADILLLLNLHSRHPWRSSAGNSVEDKTLKTRQKGMNILKKSQYAAAWLFR